MSEILQKILLALIGVALIYFPIVYRMMDKVRFHGQMLVRRMDEGLLRWIEAAQPLMMLDGGDAAAAAEYQRLAEAYRHTRAGKTAEKIRLTNDVYELVRQAAIRGYGDARARSVCRELEEIYTDISMLASDYSANAVRFNDQLSGGLAGALGRLFRMKAEPVLENLTDLKC